MKKYVVLIMAMPCFIFSIAQTTSRIDFVIRNLGVNVDGSFNTFIINTKFDAANNLIRLYGEAEVNSIETGIDSRDEHLLKEDYFYSQEYPKITLKSTEINKQSPHLYTVKVILKIKEKTKQLTIPIKIEDKGLYRAVTSNFEINRRDFDVGGGSLVMSKKVKIKVVHFEKKQ